MAKRGRKPSIDPPVDYVLSIPRSLAAKVELLLYDPVFGRPKYGGRSGLIQQLLRDWIEAQGLTPAANSAKVEFPSPPPTTHDRAETAVDSSGAGEPPTASAGE